MPPAYGTRRREIERLLSSLQPAASEDTVWAKGTMPLRVSAFVAPTELPSEFVVSVRCIVEVGDHIVVCQNADGIWHPWPGGRREPGETYPETARREVHEETGWLIDVESLEAIGWLHFEHLKPPPDDHPYPHPDWLQIVFRAVARSRDGGLDVEWIDTAGYEQRSMLVSIDDARQLVVGDALSIVFLARIHRRASSVRCAYPRRMPSEQG